MLLLRVFALLFALHILLANATSPSVVYFGQSAPFSGGAAANGPQLQSGILAAFKEVNDAGGIKGATMLQLISEDDMYNPELMAVTVPKLLAQPNLIGLLGFYGTSTGTRALELVTPHGIPIIGPFSGSSDFRHNFNPNMVLIRSGYDAEAFAILDILLNVKKARCIALYYQNDAFGAPVEASMRKALERMGMKLCYTEHYNFQDSVDDYDFTAAAKRFLAVRPQGIIFFAVGAWCTNLMIAVKQLSPETMLVTGSWTGSAVPPAFKNAGLDPSNVLLTQVMPHPESRGNRLAEHFRSAMVALSGNAAVFSYIAFEGYLSARLAVEVLNRSTTFTASEFKDILFQGRMFEIDGTVLGPYSRGCLEPPAPDDEGRSSLCNCTQGARIVYMATISNDYNFEEMDYTLKYPISDCYATETIFQYRPVVGQFYMQSNESEGNMERLLKGMKKILHGEVAVELIALDESSNVTNVLNDKLETTSLTAFVGEIGASTDRHDAAPLLSLLRIPVPLIEQHDFRRSEIAVFPDLRQQVHGTVHAMSKMHFEGSPFRQIHALYNGEYHDGRSIRKLLQLSAEHFLLPNVGYVEQFADLTKETLEPWRGVSGTVFIFGLTSDSDMNALLEFSSSNTQLDFFIPLEEAVARWSTVQYRCDNECDELDCKRVLMTTDIPLWYLANTSTEEEKAIVEEAQATGALEMMGYSLGSVLREVVASMGRKITPQAFIDTIYRMTVVTAFGHKLGPFVDVQCTSSDCLCSRGSRHVATYRYGDLAKRNFFTSSVPFDFDGCFIQYIPRPVPEDKTVATVLYSVIPSLLVIVGGAVAGVLWYFSWKKTADAPKDPERVTHIMFVSLKRESLLWENFPAGMAPALAHCNRLVKQSIKKNNCYLVKMIGGSYMIAATDALRCMRCAGDIQKETLLADWEVFLATEREEAARSISAVGTRRTDIDDSTSHTSRDSARKSHASSNAHSSATSRFDDDVTIRFGIGIHAGIVQIDYNEEANVYNYMGPIVTTSAIVSDIAQEGQILITDNVYAPEFNDHVEMFHTRAIQGKDTNLKQFNPPGQPVRVFDVVSENDAKNVDGIAAALEQASNGVVRKTITVLVASVPILQDDGTDRVLSEFSAEFLANIQHLNGVVTKEKGHIESIFGGEIIISFNAVSPTPHQATRAFAVAMEIQATFGYDVVCGIGTGKALFGPFAVGSRPYYTAIGHVVGTAHALKRYIELLDDPQVTILTLDTLIDELAVAAKVMAIDVVNVRGVTKPRRLIALIGMRDVGPSNEWMYELQTADRTDEFSETNFAFQLLCDGLQESKLTELVESLSQMKETPAVKGFARIAGCGGLQKYLMERNPLFVY